MTTRPIIAPFVLRLMLTRCKYMLQYQLPDTQSWRTWSNAELPEHLVQSHSMNEMITRLTAIKEAVEEHAAHAASIAGSKWRIIRETEEEVALL